MNAMTKKEELKDLERVMEKLERTSHPQEIVNCSSKGLRFARDIFGKNSEHHKNIEIAISSSDFDSMKQLLLEEFVSMKKVLLFGEPALRDSTIEVNFQLIHADIIRVSKKKFEDGHFGDSVESAFKEINTRVKNFYKYKSGIELDGAELMWKVFSQPTPIITLDNLSTQSGKNVQEGYMHIFAGSMMGIRNPSAHENLELSERKSIHLLYLASLLMYMIDDKLI
jgi:uncharacterized protein (TIGR02391 family)